MKATIISALLVVFAAPAFASSKVTCVTKDANGIESKQELTKKECKAAGGTVEKKAKAKK